jgi:hypothetical protein
MMMGKANNNHTFSFEQASVEYVNGIGVAAAAGGSRFKE